MTAKHERRPQPVARAFRQALNLAFCLALLGTGSAAFAQTAESGVDCPPPEASTSAPQDYRRTTPQSRVFVERRHFTPRVENLRSGESTKRPGPDIAYTLQKFPKPPPSLGVHGAPG